jgi:hypothetical protein
LVFIAKYNSRTLIFIEGIASSNPITGSRTRSVTREEGISTKKTITIRNNETRRTIVPIWTSIRNAMKNSLEI